MPACRWAFVFDKMMNHHEEELQSDVLTELDEPSLYAIVMHNDDYTTMDFVVFVLTEVFAFDIQKAVQTMLDVHHLGRATVGVFPKEIGEMKVAQVHRLAEQYEYPLLVSLEKL